jgi:hypothetical protein
MAISIERRRQKMMKAAERLSSFYGNASITDVLFQAANISSTNQEEIKKNKLSAQIQSILFDNSVGIKRSKTIVEQTNNFLNGDEGLAKHLKDTMFQIYAGPKNIQLSTSDKDSLDKILNDEEVNSQFEEPTKNSPSISVIKVNSPRFSLETNDTRPVNIFLNGIPTLELSKIVPYVEVQFNFNIPAFEDNKLTAPSIYKFLLGNEEINDGNKEIVKSSVRSEQFASGSSAGMEMFFMPQTLNDGNAQNSDYKKYPSGILDKFSSFLSLQDFEVTIMPTVGLLSYKEAKMNLVLHDRSRLSQVAALIRPDLYTATNLTIEYGWSYSSNDNKENDYGDLIDGMRFKEVFGISNSNFSILETGQVNISLQLFTKGATSIKTEIIGANKDKISTMAKEIEEMQGNIKSLLEKIYKSEDSIKEIRGHQIIDATSDVFSFPKPSATLKTSMRKFRESLSKTNKPEAKELIKEIKDLIGSDGTSGTVAKYRKSLKDSVQEIIVELKETLDQDPFLPELVVKDKEPPQITKNSAKKSPIQKAAQDFTSDVLKGKKSNKNISLAKLLLFFIGKPLLNSGIYDDVQFMFYPLNPHAGKAANKNTSEFVFELEKFVEELYKFRCEMNSRSAALTLEQFLDFIAETFLDAPNAPSYGLQNLFNEIFDKETGERKIEASDKDISDHLGRINELLKGVTPNGDWEQPQFGFYIESQPESIELVDNTDYNETEKKTRNILRIHVYDKKSSAYTSMQMLLQASKLESSLDLSNINTIPANEIIKEAIDKYKLLEPLDSEKKLYKFSGTISDMKNMFMTYSPYLIFGSTGTAIKNASLSSMQDPELSTVNTLRSFSNSELLPKNDANINLPTMVIPSQLSMQCFGCPLINFAQSYFIDFQTGTTLDNFYFVNGVTHKFSPGDFSTSVELIAQDTWGKYYNYIGHLNSALATLNDYEKRKNQT